MIQEHFQQTPFSDKSTLHHPLCRLIHNHISRKYRKKKAQSAFYMQSVLSFLFIKNYFSRHNRGTSSNSQSAFPETAFTACLRKSKRSLFTFRCNYQPSIEIVFFSSTAGFASFFGTNSVRIPCWKFALMSSSVTSSPT